MSITGQVPDNVNPCLQRALPNGVPTGLNGLPKRTLDIFIALSALIFMAPLLGAIALLIKVRDGGPVTFRHVRCGQHGAPFTLLKFRTMCRDADRRLEELLATDEEAAAHWDNFQKLPRDPRITRVGRFLRRASLDELPQLLNVLRGEMSIVGPRPITRGELDRFGTLVPVYEAARPGLTGLWQVSGRNDTDFDTRIRLDTQYVREWSLRKDVMIILRTVPVVLTGKGAY